MSRKVLKPKYEAPRTFMMGEIGTSSGGCGYGGHFHDNNCTGGNNAVTCGIGSGATHGAGCTPSGNLPQ
jgi:hypothetical protein